MLRLCERPGCSEPGAAAYGMVSEDLLFWVAPLDGSFDAGSNVLCRRHADAMTVPNGWTLDDRREDQPRLFKPRAADTAPSAPKASRRRPKTASADARPEQLQIDGTGEIPRPSNSELPYDSWQPDFDHDDDLDGLLKVDSPLLARAFGGTDRPRRG